MNSKKYSGSVFHVTSSEQEVENLLRFVLRVAPTEEFSHFFNLTCFGE